VGPPRTRHAWLSITPEPERELPAAIATLRAGRMPNRAAITAEQERVERLITRGSRRAWTAYIAEAAALARAASAEDEVAEARELVLEVVQNHDNLRLGLPGGTE
jgi:hydroxymethylpyrimidine/phosphomethylpyrimidine kinase